MLQLFQVQQQLLNMLEILQFSDVINNYLRVIASIKREIKKGHTGVLAL